MADNDAQEQAREAPGGKVVRPIIIKKIKKGGGHGHHGGAWKVAYADFVTAMMAFFLLLWLLNTSTVDQRAGISNYFAPTTVSNTKSGAGGLLAGASLSEIAALQSPANPMLNPQEVPPGVETDEDNPGDEIVSQNDHDKLSQDASALREREKERFEKLAEQLRQSIQNDPQLADLAKNLLVELTPEGLRIQLVDSEGNPMFDAGRTRPLPRAEKLLQKVSEVIRRVPNELSVSGHTDSTQFRSYNGYTNWELSADRAHATRRTMARFGVPEGRFSVVSGRADRDPLIRDNPTAVANRRMSITLLYTDISNAARQKESPSTPINQGVFR
jgi:chemotaxis protein MotB